MCPARIAAGEHAPRYERHQPEKTLLYQIIDEHYPQFLAHLERQGRSLPLYVQSEFDDYLQRSRDRFGQSSFAAIKIITLIILFDHSAHLPVILYYAPLWHGLRLPGF
jgi:hypothetical protein